MTIKTHNNTFIGIVDILGFTNNESAASGHGTFFQKKVFQSLDSSSKQAFRPNIDIHRYGDGYVLISESLKDVVIGSNYLVATALTQHIPLRVALTQGDLTVSSSNDSGLTISGRDWPKLMELEKKLNCMGGILHLPQLDGKVYPEIQRLISETRLIKVINNGITPGFSVPLKTEHKLQDDKYWFLNWQKPFQLKPDQISSFVNSWWNGYPSTTNGPADNTVTIKQENTIEFGHYCYQLHDAIKRSWNAGVIKDFNIGPVLSEQ